MLTGQEFFHRHVFQSGLAAEDFLTLRLVSEGLRRLAALSHLPRAQLLQDALVVGLDSLTGGLSKSFIDVGSGEAIEHSNTYLLEQALGWNGVAIDPRGSLGPSYVAERPLTKFLAVALDPEADGDGETSLLVSDELSSTVWTHSTDNWNRTRFRLAAEGAIRRVPTMSLSSLAQHLGPLDDYGYLSIDTEGQDGLILEGVLGLGLLPAVITAELSKFESERFESKAGKRSFPYFRIGRVLSRWDVWYVREDIFGGLADEIPSRG